MKTFIISNWQKIVAATLTATTIFYTTNAASAQLLKGGGAAFSEPLYQRYSAEYERETGIKFQYTAVGSGGGVRLFTNQTVDIGGTTLIPTPIEKNQMQDGLLMVPTGGGAIAIVYNLEDVTYNVKLSREQLAKIFTGQISNWNQVDSRFPNKKIQVIVQSDGSGTTLTLTRYLRKITGGKIEASRTPNWGFQVFATVPQDSSVAGEVRRIDGAIGYIQTSFARQNNLSTARIENRAGRYVEPTLAETEKALANIKFNDDFTTEDIDDPEDGYPLVSLSWLLFSEKYNNETLVQTNKNLLTWILTKGQELNRELGYTKIPEDVANKVIETANNELKVRP
ncbi:MULTISPECIES: phosphate ABC transporter substrate-binding protein PstS [unclassified Nodularia (in: cyanobacteria)]|uniref:phosphate ABC transporter substrate-binding protein PstS n=1 Tax=unclassified Nodularia (in: cyanobacteria) TaxID=2656917 RepID=UPI00188280A0|nr:MULTISPECIES: phosphate ABC transporter substrate-binding protein PstS [unclassified Nodularia (in: cyanobacteria)]MBE9200875.1 phosphate ABC transporter substrate-binding protein PstS [Nodularia sp. LEGE 06071]MCC2692365.1 phosphate ABC transporter substrate-binding protein PstS [Nodularia sp. LEGE 04288]